MKFALYRSAIKSTVLFAACLLPLVAANAQHGYYDDRRNDRESYISIFSDCDFRGERRDIAVGEFRSMRELDFGNDKLSSIQVPSDLEAVLFEHDDFKGDYARVDRDVRCFDENWNDEVSSLRVERRYDGRQQGDRPVYGGRDNQKPGRQYNDGVSSQNISQVVFNRRVLQQVDDRLWEINDRRLGISQYQETSRDRDNVYLTNSYTGGRIQIDVPSNIVTVIGPRGGARQHNITSRKAQLITAQPRPDDNIIRGRCFDYHAYTNGKTGSIRFSTEKGVNKFQDRGHKGRICHRGELVIEMGKRDFDTDYTLAIQGRTFKFASGEKETQYRNNWYRKVIKLQVGR